MYVSFQCSKRHELEIKQSKMLGLQENYETCVALAIKV